MACDALQTSTRLLPERWLHFAVCSVFLEEKRAVDKLLWRQQRAFVALRCRYPPLRGRKRGKAGWALPPHGEPEARAPVPLPTGPCPRSSRSTPPSPRLSV